MISACCVCFWCGQSMEWILMLTGNLPQQVSVGLQRQNHRPLWKTRRVRTHVCRYVRTKSDDTSCLCMLSHFKSGRLFSQVQIFGYNLSVEFVQTRFCLLLPDHTVSVVLQESNPFFSVIVQCGCTHNILPTFKRPGCTEQPNNSMDFPNLKAAPSASGR